jgi:hypothetical protein
VEVVSTVGAWLEVAALTTAQDRADAWVASYEARFPTVFEVYYRAWGNPSARHTAAILAPALVEQVVAAEVRAMNLLGRAEADFRTHGLLEGDDLHAALMVGGHSSNGWVAEHQGLPTLFLALEYLGGPPFDDLLVVHELAHVAQAQRSAATRAPTFPASLAVMVEGAATTTSRVLRPGFDDGAYLWMDSDHDDWLDECVSATPGIAALLLEHADTLDDDEAVAPLVRNRPEAGIPPRSGYWVGDLISRTMLQRGCGLGELLSIGPNQARDLVLRWARAHNG